MIFLDTYKKKSILKNSQPAKIKENVKLHKTSKTIRPVVSKINIVNKNWSSKLSSIIYTFYYKSKC